MTTKPSTEHNDDHLVVLLQSGDLTLAEQCRALSPRVRVVLRDSIAQYPKLPGEIQVVYGGLSPDRWPLFPRLEWVQVTGAGVESYLTPEVVASPVILTNVSGIHAVPITEHMFGMLLAYNRRLFWSWDLQSKSKWGAEGINKDIRTLHGKTLGLLGMGRIGEQSARVGRAFGMQTFGLRRSGVPHPDVERMYTLSHLHAFLGECDVVMNTLPLTPETRGLLSTDALEAMKEGSVLINTGRGATVDTDALVAGLRTGHPGAALLDVTDPEPLPEDHPLWKMENVVITPHYAGAFAEYNQQAERIFLDNLGRYLQNSGLTHVVDKKAGY